LFCRRTIKEKGRTGVDRPGRLIGGRQTHQTRSYFALKLPHGWWLWGTDSQLEGYIDQPQIDFFQFVAEKWMAPGSKLILCTGTPDWEYVDPDKPEGGFTTFSYLERLAPAAGKGHRVKLVLSGDSHHYARFQEDGLNYITCGGGGAFLHPTHNLEREKSFLFPFPPPGERAERGKTYPRLFKLMKKGGDADGKDEALFPSRADSARLSWGFPAFALRNPGLTLTLAGLYFFFTWLLDFHSRLSEHKPLVSALGSAASLREAACLYWQIASFSPWPILLSVLSWAGYYYFADFTATVRRVLVGGAHALLQAVTVTLVTCLLIRWVGSPDGHPLEMAAALVAASIGAALASSTLMGLYLWFCISVWGAHWGHFSALAVEDYKSFLRLRIDEKGVLHVFPIGLRKVPDDRGRRSGEPAALHSELIEPPILIG
ncbi:MAG: hypothetical protein ACXW2T_03095, partial [Allosphingosinicella sp.]